MNVVSHKERIPLALILSIKVPKLATPLSYSTHIANVSKFLVVTILYRYVRMRVNDVIINSCCGRGIGVAYTTKKEDEEQWVMLKFIVAYSTRVGRKMSSWRKIVALAVVLGLVILIWQCTHLFQVIHKAEDPLEREASLFGANLDEAHRRSIHWTKLKSNSVESEQAIKQHSPVTNKEKELIVGQKQDMPTVAKGVGVGAKVEHQPVLDSAKHNGHSPAGNIYLSSDVIDKVEKFVFFIGYQRSGHSIIGSFMDAHPHMIIAHEFMLFNKWKEMDEAFEESGVPNKLRDKKTLFNLLYKDSYEDAEHGWRSSQMKNKNYTLTIDSGWQGRFNRYISIIGDKSGGATTTVYTSSPQRFRRYFTQLNETVKIPIRVLHVVRNPFDMIATDALYSEGKRQKAKTGIRQALFVSNLKKNLSNFRAAGKMAAFAAARISNQTLVESRTKAITRLANGNSEIVRLLGEENVLELHNCDLVSDPISTLKKICEFMEVPCSQEYLKACADKVFKTVSNTRKLVVWPTSTREKVENLIKQHSFFHRYSFEGE